MKRVLSLLGIIASFTTVGFADSPAPAAPPFTDLAREFTRLYDATTDLAPAVRAQRFQAELNARLPGFYEPRNGATPAQFQRRIERALQDFATWRASIEAVSASFPAAFESGLAHFRRQFPGFTPHMPVFLVHSLGEMDGGTREFAGKNYLIFGADVIAQLHDAADITPLLDHELFHVEHQKYFTDCDQVWCPLWAEGLATYATKVMNPGVTDKQLLLTFPKPIRGDVDAQWPAALCFTRERLYSAEGVDLEAMFMGGGAAARFPQRFGYYVGLRLAEELGARHGLQELARMPSDEVKAALTATLDEAIRKAGGCG